MCFVEYFLEEYEKKDENKKELNCWRIYTIYIYKRNIAWQFLFGNTWRATLSSIWKLEHERPKYTSAKSLSKRDASARFFISGITKNMPIIPTTNMQNSQQSGKSFGAFFALENIEQSYYLCLKMFAWFHWKSRRQYFDSLNCTSHL